MAPYSQQMRHGVPHPLHHPAPWATAPPDLQTEIMRGQLEWTERGLFDLLYTILAQKFARVGSEGAALEKERVLYSQIAKLLVHTVPSSLASVIYYYAALVQVTQLHAQPARADVFVYEASRPDTREEREAESAFARETTAAMERVSCVANAYWVWCRNYFKVRCIPSPREALEIDKQWDIG
jgi:hypothetical protein